MEIRLILLVAALMPAGSARAATEEFPITPAARQLLDAAGIDEEAYLQPTDACKQKSAKIAGVKGIMTLEPSSYDCQGDPQFISSGQTKTSLSMNFIANIPVTKCVSFEMSEEYLLNHGWKRDPGKPAENFLDGALGFLPPITIDFIDGAGATFTLEPYLRKSCLTKATLKIEADSTAR